MLFPHWGQNFEPCGKEALQCPQAIFSESFVPHTMQNTASAGRSIPHAGQRLVATI
jgi:hypothetical protein